MIVSRAGTTQSAEAMLNSVATITESETDEEAELREEARLRHGGPTTETSPARLALWVGAAFLAALILIWILYELS